MKSTRPRVQFFVSFLFLLFVSVPVMRAQKALSIGDRMPDVTINNVMNHNPSAVRVSDFKGRLLVLDFWATWCSPCVAMFPRMDSLQKVFKDQVFFLSVTYEDRGKVEKLFKRSPKLKGLTPPIVPGDTALQKLFPHSSLPHYAWIDGGGIVRAITGLDEVTGETIRDLLSGSDAHLEVKKDVRVPFDRDKALLLNNARISTSDIQYQSLLTGYVEQLGGRMDVLRHEDGGIARVTHSNHQYTRLAAMAHSSPTFFVERNRVIVEVKDPSKLLMQGPDRASREAMRAWTRENTFCYEIIVPPHLSSRIFELMREDMDKLFPQYKAALEKRKTKCLVLERTSDVDKIATRGGDTKFSFASYEANMTNCSLGLLMNQLNGLSMQHLRMPIVDRTGYTGRVDLRLDCTLSDPKSLRQALKAYDLDLVEKEIMVDMLVIRDAP